MGLVAACLLGAAATGAGLWHFWARSKASSESIVITSPQSGATVGPTFSVYGEASTTWFPTGLLFAGAWEANGDLIFEGIEAVATGSINSDGLTPFAFQVRTTDIYDDVGIYAGPATIVIESDASTLEPKPRQDLMIPIMLKKRN
jgi:hypothetical protein